jgi:hypothetical protein
MCLAPLLCCACSISAERGDDALHPRYSAYGKPPGYYPGYSDPSDDATEFARWLAKNKAGIDDIQRRIVEIREGRRPPGCIGEEKYTCVATLAQKLAIADEYSGGGIFEEIKYDVNGKPMNGSKLTFEGYGPNAKENPILYLFHRTIFTVRFGLDGRVTKVEARLHENPISARTQEEYDRTDAYESVSAVTARTCPALGRSEVAKWIENTIKPSFQAGPKESFRDSDGRRVTSIDYAARPTTLCGRVFVFHTIVQTTHYAFRHEDYVAPKIEIR